MNKKLLMKVLWVLIAAFVIMITVGAGCDMNAPLGGDDDSDSTEESGEDAEVKFCVQTPEEAEDGLYYSLPLGREDTVKADDGTIFTVLCNAASGTATVTEVEEEVDLDCVDDIVHVGTSQKAVFAKAGETKQVTIEGVTVEVTCIGTTGNFSQPVFISDNRDAEEAAPDDEDLPGGFDDHEEDGEINAGDVDDQASGGTTCDVQVISSTSEQYVINTDMGDPYNFWALVLLATDDDPAVLVVGDPMTSIEIQNPTMTGAEYIIKAKNAEDVACYMATVVEDMGLDPYHIYLTLGDEMLSGFTDELLTSWGMEVTYYAEEPIADGNNWSDKVEFSVGRETEICSNDVSYTIIQSWDTLVGTDPAQHGIVAPNYCLKLASTYQGSYWMVEPTKSLEQLFLRFLQMVAEVRDRDDNKVRMSYCGPENGDRPDSWDDALPTGWTCKAQD